MIKFIFILFLFKNIFSYKILVFSPTVSASHMILDARVARCKSIRGDPFKNIPPGLMVRIF